MNKKNHWVIGVILLMVLAVFGPVQADPADVLKVYPIGKVVKEKGRTFIVLDKTYQPGLLGLDQASSVLVLYWFDRNDTPKKRSILRVHPRGNPDNPLTGVFASRSPVRPNLIGVTRCGIVEIRGNIIEVDGIDAFDESPVIDLKR